VEKLLQELHQGQKEQKSAIAELKKNQNELKSEFADQTNAIMQQIKGFKDEVL
jgi:hypothetical protein